MGRIPRKQHQSTPENSGNHMYTDFKDTGHPAGGGLDQTLFLDFISHCVRMTYIIIIAPSAKRTMHLDLVALTR